MSTKDLEKFKKDTKYTQALKLMEEIRDLQFLNGALKAEIKIWKAEVNKLKKESMIFIMV